MSEVAVQRRGCTLRAMDDGPDDQPIHADSPPGSGRAGGRSGCLAALLFAFPTGAVVVLGVTMGDCALNRNCHRNDGELLLAGLAIVLALATLFGLAIRVLVRRSRLRGTEAAPGGWSLALRFRPRSCSGCSPSGASWRFSA